MDDARLGLLLVTATALVNIGLSVLVGALASLWSFRRQPSAWSASQAARSSKLCVSAAVWSLVATVFLLWVQTALMSDLPLLEATSALGGVLMQTHLGHAWLFGTLTLLVLLSLASSSERLMTLPFLVAASLCVAVILASKSAASHAGAQSLLLPVVIDWLHLVSINVWSGFVVVATGIVLRGPVPHDLLDRHAYGRYIEALSGAATLALAGVMATGSYSSWRGLAGFVPGAMASTYGVIWLVKMLLVAAAIALGGFNRFVTMPPLLAALRSPRDAFDRSLRTFSVVLRLESVLLLVILGVAAALSTSPPSRTPDFFSSSSGVLMNHHKRSSPPSWRIAALSIGLAGIPFFAVGQSAPMGAMPAATAASAPPASNEKPPMPEHGMSSMPGHDMSSMKGMSMDDDMMMKSALGSYSMTRDGSGTSWQPEATPMEGLHMMEGDWSLMAHGYVNAIYDKQSGPRGNKKSFTGSMAMLMGNRLVGPGTLGLRAMVSLDPTMSKSGYPLLFQTGETADGKTPLVDRQHPHDLFMELSTSYSLPIGSDGAAFAYFGLPGEPALGPAAFMHRFSGMRNPEAPLTHHWLDSTHITFGVATVGASKGPFQLEGSWFNGREPDQFRWNIETRKFDSWSTRLSYNPLPELSMQVSYGDLKSPEQLEPDTRVKRTTASATYFRKSDDSSWGTTLAYGRNKKSGPTTNVSEPGWLLESTYTLRDTHTVFARVEQVRNSELFQEGQPLHGEQFTIRKFSVGYIYDFAKTGPVKWGLGGLVGFARAPSQLDPYYGGSPRSYMVFLQGRL